MKKWLGLFVALVLFSVLAACGPDEAKDSDKKDSTSNSGESAESSMPEKPESLTIWVNAEEKQEQAVKQITDKYTEETGIAVELVPINMLDQVEKLDVEGPAGNGPDIIFQPHDRIGDLAMRGLV